MKTHSQANITHARFISKFILILENDKEYAKHLKGTIYYNFLNTLQSQNKNKTIITNDNK